MNASQIHAEPLADTQAAVLLRQVALSQATRLARDGSYAAAEELLSGVLATERPDASVLDLLARIRVQQGALLDAESLWRKALQLDPNHLGASAGLERLRGEQRTPVWLQPVLVALIGFGAILCGVLALAWQTRHTAAANANLQQRVVEVVKAESRTAHQQVQGLLAEVQMLSSNQARAERSLGKIGDFSAKLDGWQDTQGALSAQVKDLQAEAKRLATQQEGLALSSSNQVDTLHRSFKQGLASVKADSGQQAELLQADVKRLAAQQEAGALAVRNQVTALRLTVDHERTLAKEIERHRAVNEKLQNDYDALAAKHERVLAQAGLMTNSPNMTIGVAGVRTSIEGRYMVVMFDEGVFDHGAHFKLGAKSTLQNVAVALAQAPQPLQVEVIGYADDDRAFLKWTAQWESSLALERAAAVVDNFIELGLFRPGNVSAVSGGDKRPFGSNSGQNRAKNRTVVLRVSFAH